MSRNCFCISFSPRLCHDTFPLASRVWHHFVSHRDCFICARFHSHYPSAKKRAWALSDDDEGATISRVYLQNMAAQRVVASSKNNSRAFILLWKLVKVHAAALDTFCYIPKREHPPWITKVKSIKAKFLLLKRVNLKRRAGDDWIVIIVEVRWIQSMKFANQNLFLNVL